MAAIDICNKVFQARNITLDVEVPNIEALLEDFMKLRSNWNEAKEVARNVELEIKLCHGCGGLGRKRKKTRMHDDTSTPDANLEEMTDTDHSPEEA